MIKNYTGTIEISPIGPNFTLTNPSMEVKSIEYIDNNCYACVQFIEDDLATTIKRILIANPVNGETYDETQIALFILNHETLGNFI